MSGVAGTADPAANAPDDDAAAGSIGSGFRRADWLVGLIVLLCGLYFYNGHSWNQLARYDVIYGFVEPDTVDTGALSINSFVPYPQAGINTGDWARNPAHDPVRLYSNKAPGPILLGIVCYQVIYHVETAVGMNPLDPVTTQWNCWLLNVLVNVLPMAFAAVFFQRLLRRLAPSAPRWAALVTVALVVASISMPYVTSFWGYAPAAACIILAMACYQSGGARGLILAGFWAGCAVLCEYTCGLAVALLALAVAWRDAGRPGPIDPKAALQRLVFYGLGGLPTAVIYAVYHQICFGVWWVPASSHSNPVFLGQDDIGGLFSGLQVEALWGLSFSRYRGLFYTMPWLILALPSLAVLGSRRLRLWGVISVLGIAGFLLVNLSFNGWHGGATVGPRYQIPALPFWALLIFLGGVRFMAWCRRHRRATARRLAFIGSCVLMAIATAHMTVMTVTTHMISQASPDPLRECYARFLNRDWHVPLHPARVDAAALPLELQTFNLGERIGLAGFPSIVPWLLLMAVLIVLALRAPTRAKAQ